MFTVFQSDPNQVEFAFIALFPNFEARPPTTAGFDTPSIVDACDTDIAPSLRDPSGRVLPTEYFMFMEYGPDLIFQTDGRPLAGSVLQFTIGFR